MAVDERVLRLLPAVEATVAGVADVETAVGLPLIETLVRARDLAAVEASLERLPWRWRTEGDGVRRPDRAYHFDDGVVLVIRVRRSALGRSWRRIVAGARRRLGLVPQPPRPVRSRFCGMELVVGPSVFVPRATTERLVAAALGTVPVDRPAVVVDVGTGCGAAAIAIARQRPTATVLGLDVDEGALRWGRENARRLGADVRFVTSSVLDALPDDVARQGIDTVLGNLPCLRPGDHVPQADAPDAAYVGRDDDGLGLQREAAAQAVSILRPGGHLVLQVPADGVPALADHVGSLGYVVDSAERDGVAAYVVARWLAADRPPGG